MTVQVGLLLARLLVGNMLSLAPAVFFEFEAFGTAGFFLNPVITIAARGAFQPDILAHRLLLPASPGRWPGQ